MLLDHSLICHDLAMKLLQIPKFGLLDELQLYLLPVTSHHDKTLQILSAGVQEICSRKADV
jgi:hypothetical protein